jgi:hypothetical protein
MTILKLGDRNPTSIANAAIALLRKNQARIVRQHVARGLANDHPVGAVR